MRVASTLSAIVAALAAAVSLVGLRSPALYRSKDWGNGMSLGNDLVTLAGRSYAYDVVRSLSSLYLAEGLR